MLAEEKKQRPVATGLENRLNRIVLTGYRATGKSRIGRGLAEQLGWDFIDTDYLLAEELQCSLTDFVRDRGWDAFRQEEEKLLATLTNTSNVVVATGGGAIMHHGVWQDLRKNGLVIWLQAEPEVIRKRLDLDRRSDSQRPALTGSSLTDEVEEVLAFRQQFYDKGSDIAVDTTKMSPEDIIVHIIQVLTDGEII